MPGDKSPLPPALAETDSAEAQRVFPGTAATSVGLSFLHRWQWAACWAWRGHQKICYLVLKGEGRQDPTVPS